MYNKYVLYKKLCREAILFSCNFFGATHGLTVFAFVSATGHLLLGRINTLQEYLGVYNVL